MTNRISNRDIKNFEKQNDLTRNVMVSNRNAGRHSFEFGGDNYIIDEMVFSPKYWEGYKTFIRALTELPLNNKSFLEIGTGCGVVALHLLKHYNLAHATLTDIFEKAVTNAEVNAKNMNLSDKTDFFVSDIFNDLKTSQKYDFIFWNYPWLPETDDYTFTDVLDRTLFDPGYKTIERYISESRNYIKPDGKVLFGFGDYGHWSLLKDICKKLNLEPKIIFEEESIEGGGKVKYQLIEIHFLK